MTFNVTNIITRLTRKFDKPLMYGAIRACVNLHYEPTSGAGTVNRNYYIWVIDKVFADSFRSRKAHTDFRLRSPPPKESFLDCLRTQYNPIEKDCEELCVIFEITIAELVSFDNMLE